MSEKHQVDVERAWVTEETKRFNELARKFVESQKRIAELEATLASRPPALAWMSEPPKVPGLYLICQKNTRSMSTWKHEDGHSREFMANYLWYGPIPEPPESPAAAPAQPDPA